MNLKKMTDEELVNIRDEVEVWCGKYTQSIWSGGKGYAVALFGAFGISTGMVFIIMDGFEPASLIPILLGVVICFIWFKAEQQYKKNNSFLGEVKNEIVQRKKKTERKITKKTNT
jgi:hypothetical protein